MANPNWYLKCQNKWLHRLNPSSHDQADESLIEQQQYDLLDGNLLALATGNASKINQQFDEVPKKIRKKETLSMGAVTEV